MAVLKARGRTELLRFEKEAQAHSDLTDWERVTITIMSDRTILKKRDVRFLPDTYNPTGRRHTWGWKVAGKIKEGADLVRIQEWYEARGFERQ